MLNRKNAPHIHDAVDFSLTLHSPQHFKLDNGVPVYAINAGTQDVVSLELVFYAGNWYEDQNVIAASANFLIKNGTSKKTAYEINEDVEFYGAHFNRACYNETASISLHCLSRHLDDLLPLITEVITDAVYPQEEIDIYRQNQKQRLKVNLKKCDFVANRLIDEYLFGINHPYGKYSNEADYDKITREQLIAFYQRYYLNGKLVVFAGGRLPANFEYLLNQALGHLPFNKQEQPLVSHPITPVAQKKFKIINDNESVQGAIRIARPFPNRHHPHFVPVQVLNNIFGGFFGSRLMSNIREDKGYTYGIHSYLQNHLQQCAWMISTEAGRDVCEATIREVYNEMQILRNEVVDEEELNLVRNYMLGTILGDLDGPFQLISRWKNYILNGIDESYFYNTIQIIKTVKAEELNELAKTYLNPDEFYELLVI